MIAEDQALVQRALAWLRADPDPETRAEMERSLGESDVGALRSYFEPPLVFGTAGLRGAVGPGPARMNRAVVRRAAWALGRFLTEAGLGHRRVVVGFDARLTSEALARDTVQVLAAQGFEVLYFAEPCPTPWVAFACRRLEGAAGVVVTASHNPRGDNGYKVYDDQGIQVVAPWDERIAELIAQAPPADAIELREGGRPVPVELIDEYFAVFRASPHPEGPPLRVAYTPLHGVGLASIRRALEGSGRAQLSVVAEQAEPDGTFPTVDFPNPEEPGVVDRLLALAEEHGCDLALANDPDADRLAVCLPARDGWRRLSGDEVGILLADHLLEEVAAEGGTERPEGAVVASSIVSSPMLEHVAAAHGARVERTLTGFKWLCRVPAHLEASERFVLAYEEALGYALDPRVLDKDGISAAVCFVDLARALGRRGLTVAAHLAALYRRHGLWWSYPSSVRLEGFDAPQRMVEALDRLRHAPPTELASMPVQRLIDYAVGAAERPVYLGAQDLLQLELGPAPGGGASYGRVLVRPSGTEPKVKLYVYLRAVADDGEARELGDLDRLRAGLERQGERLSRQLCESIGLG